MRYSQRPIGLLLLCLIALGCGKSGPKTVSVSGKVTMDDQPLANATVSFIPADGKDITAKEAVGQTDAQGNYSLKLNQSQASGAAPGEYKVSISLIERGASLTNVVPEEYNKKTKLTFTVPDAGTKEANFPLKKNPSGAGQGPRR
jgi:hypothetical protein